MTRTLGLAAFEFKTDPAGAFEQTAALGVQTCEIVTPADVTPATAEAVRRVADEHGVRVTAVASLSKPNTTDDDAEGHIELLDDSIIAAAALGAPFAITYFGGHPTRSVPEAIERYARLTRRSMARAAELGVTVLIENHFSHAPGEATNTAQGCLALVQAVDSPAFAVNFDHCNFAIGGQDLVDAYQLLKPHIRNVHVKDARPFDPELDADYDGRIVTDLVQGDFIFVPVGEGITDNDAILSRVVADDLDVPVTVEVHVPERMVTKAFEVGLEYCRSRGV
jgi:sugar phosphate isomerase/epimerase